MQLYNKHYTGNMAFHDSLLACNVLCKVHTIAAEYCLFASQGSKEMLENKQTKKCLKCAKWSYSGALRNITLLMILENMLAVQVIVRVKFIYADFV